jgi:hypothetical protein
VRTFALAVALRASTDPHGADPSAERGTAEADEYYERLLAALESFAALGSIAAGTEPQHRLSSLDRQHGGR